MSEAVGAQDDEGREGSVDLALVSRIESELDAVERALEQVDQGVYEGFAGLGDSPTAVMEATEQSAGSGGSAGGPPAYG